MERHIMSKTVNKVLLLGNVGKDPEIASTNGGTLVAKLSLATSERFKDKQASGRSAQSGTTWSPTLAAPRFCATMCTRGRNCTSKDGSPRGPGTIRRAARKSIEPRSWLGTSACFRIMDILGRLLPISVRHAMNGTRKRPATSTVLASRTQRFRSNLGSFGKCPVSPEQVQPSQGCSSARSH
jgi:hypothetical protein